jgi:hypothetical protein
LGALTFAPLCIYGSKGSSGSVAPDCARSEALHILADVLDASEWQRAPSASQGAIGAKAAGACDFHLPSAQLHASTGGGGLFPHRLLALMGLSCEGATWSSSARAAAAAAGSQDEGVAAPCHQHQAANHSAAAGAASGALALAAQGSAGQARAAATSGAGSALRAVWSLMQQVRHSKVEWDRCGMVQRVMQLIGS